MGQIKICSNKILGDGMKIYIVRHGQTDSNANQVYNVLDEDINDVGVAQATQLREKIKCMTFDAVIVSPLLRARHTAEIITDNAPMIFDNRIRERDLGSLTGMPLSSVPRDDYWDFNNNVRYGTAETVSELVTRVYDFIDDLKTKDYKSVLIVAHSGVSRAFDVYFNGTQDGKLLNRNIANCAVKEYVL